MATGIDLPDVQTTRDEIRRWQLSAVCLFLLLFGIYVLSHPGRIDSIDGQLRYDVSRNLLDGHGPQISDPVLVSGKLPANPTTGIKYAYYGAPASLVASIPMLVSRMLYSGSASSERFAFSITSAGFGALIAPLLLALYRRLKVPLAAACGWTLLFALSTQWWPGSETIYDQNQHAVVLLALVLCALDAHEKPSLAKAALSGILVGVLINYRTPFVVVAPAVQIYWWQESRHSNRSSFKGRSALYVTGVLLGLVCLLAYNYIRFGQFQMPHYDSQDVIGNPVTGLLVLAVSPGKGFLWFSPPLIIALVGIKGLSRSRPNLLKLLLGLTLPYLFLICCLLFVAGDWCWGPRYILPIMPLWALALPYARGLIVSKTCITLLTAAGLLVQILGLSVPTDRFFWSRRFTTDLTPDFRHYTWQFYFHESQLVSRPAELSETIHDVHSDHPETNFNPHDDATYTSFGPQVANLLPNVIKSLESGPGPELGSDTITNTVEEHQRWVFERANKHLRETEDNYKMHFMLRPWCVWSRGVPQEQSPKGLQILLLASLTSSILGAIGTIAVLKRGKTAE